MILITMPNKSADALFQLVKSLEKSEKRNFKLYVKRNSSVGDLKIVQLFDALVGMEDYDEELLLKKNKAITKLQLSNIKASLYKELLASIRLLQSEVNIDIQLHEQLDYARILYNKGLYLQSLKLLDKIKELTKANNQVSFLIQVLFLEKKIESLHITRSMQDRADTLCKEVTDANTRLTMIGQLSNLSLQLYSWYIKNGHARNKKDEEAVQHYFNEHLTFDVKICAGFYEKLYLYQSYCWYAFIRQDFLMYYRYTQKWVDLFEKEPFMIEIETTHYIKGMHNLLSAHFDLRNDAKFSAELERFEAFSQSPLMALKENNRIQTFLYLYIARINQHFLRGTFSKGLELVPGIETFITENKIFLDRHRILVFYYKIASLYFGSADYDHAVDYLNKIINWKVDLRTDLQCYARLLHLIAHYELGNFQLLEYLIKSVYRFMAKMENLSVVEEEMFRFLKKAFSLTPARLKPEFQKLLDKLKHYEYSNSETRAFAYLDIISWLDSKMEGVPVQDVIRRKYLAKNKAIS
ncbi:MAG: hypothetical protein ABIX01_22250 [Chitinophagaceae bacterium]